MWVYFATLSLPAHDVLSRRVYYTPASHALDFFDTPA